MCAEGAVPFGAQSRNGYTYADGTGRALQKGIEKPILGFCLVRTFNLDQCNGSDASFYAAKSR